MDSRLETTALVGFNRILTMCLILTLPEANVEERGKNTIFGTCFCQFCIVTLQRLLFNRQFCQICASTLFVVYCGNYRRFETIKF